MTKKDIRNYTYEDLMDYMKSINEKPFRTGQIFDWLYKKGAIGFYEMKNIPSKLIGKLEKDFSLHKTCVLNEGISKDQTKKILFKLKDGEKIETVFIPSKTRGTVCVSTQVGCKYGCKFCASAIGGWVRDLSCAEIIEQILYVKNSNPNKPLSHIVFMGVGEPLDNYENLIKAIKIVNSKKGFYIAKRRITVSTCGLVPMILQLAKEDLHVELAVSLHSPNNKIRDILMPINKKYHLEELIKACKNYVAITKRLITFEYILIKNITCTKEEARELVRLLKGINCKVNLIEYNNIYEFKYESPSSKEIEIFKDFLIENKINTTIRRPRGSDVSGACGQLRHI